MTSREAVVNMINYVNFKGEGLRFDARYEGVGCVKIQMLIGCLGG